MSIAIGVGAIFFSWAARICIRLLQHLLSGHNVLALLRGKRVTEVGSGRELGSRSASGRTLSGKNLGARAGSSMAGRTGWPHRVWPRAQWQPCACGPGAAATGRPEHDAGAACRREGRLELISAVMRETRCQKLR